MNNTAEKTFIMRSKIKTIFSEELLKLIGSICDTKRIDSNQKKMKMAQQLLKRYEKRFDVLGGATNRLALFMDSYTIKIALDRQGYKDNLMEFSLSRELQPFVTKTYESNGYILVAEPVKTMTLDDFHLRKMDILKTLEALSQDYLLGDVGYVKKNFTNWGIRDDGRVVILDYAYIHRATENLFTCDVCGDGLLAYDSTYSYLRCTNATVCQTKYTYHERKTIQGDQVDIEMIDEAKEYAVKIGPGETTKKMKIVDGDMVDSNVRTIHSIEDYKKYIEEELLMIYDDFNQNEAADLMLERMHATSQEEIDAINAKMDKLIGPIKDDVIFEEEHEESSTAVEFVKQIVIDAIQPDSVADEEAKLEDDPDADVEPMSEDELFSILEKNKPVMRSRDVEVGYGQPPEDGYEDENDPLVILEQIRKRNSQKGPYGYDVVTTDTHYPSTNQSKPYNNNKKKGGKR